MRRCAEIAAAVAFLVLARQAPAACNVTATGVSFGAYDVFVTTPTDAVGSIAVSCDEVPPSDVIVSISPGSSGIYFPRQMRRAGGPDRLNYNLFTTPAMSAVWGDGTGGSSTVFLKNVKRPRHPVVTPLYGRIPPGQDVSVGSYSDSVTVTVTW